MIDAKRSFRKILRDWGHDVHIQRILQNGNHSNSLERVTTRQVGQSGIANTLSTKEQADGLITKYDAVYYFEAEIYPKEGDRIYENYSMKNHKNYTMYRINAVSAVRGKLGKIVFWTVGASREK
jgi:oxalate decarboxylase/phosphoglucose isomerase-like protein (cupin superfamily)